MYDRTKSVFPERLCSGKIMDGDTNTVVPPEDIQTGGGDALYGGAVRVRRGRRRKGGMPVVSEKKTEPTLSAVAPSEKSKRTYTIVKMVMALMFAKDGGEYKIPDDTFRVSNLTDSNCTKKKNDWASAVKANFTEPTNETQESLETTQRAFAECMCNAILKANGSGSPDQNELATILASADRNVAIEMVDNTITFIMSMNVGFAPGGGESIAGGGDDDEEEELQVGGMNVPGMPSRRSSSSSPAPAPAAVLAQVAAAPSLPAQLAIAREAQGGAEAPSVSFELARTAFRLFLSPFRSCARGLPSSEDVTRQMNNLAERVEGANLLLPSVAVSTAAAGLLMPGAAGAALTGAANTLDAVNAFIPGGLSVLSGFATGTVPAAAGLAMSAAALGASSAGLYVASRAVGALTQTGVKCAVGVARAGVGATVSAGDAVVSAIEGAPERSVGALVSATPAMERAGKRAAVAVRTAFEGLGGARSAQVARIAEANAMAVENVVEALDEPAARAAAAEGARNVRAAIAAAGGAGEAADAAGAAVEQRLTLLSGKKRGREDGDSESKEDEAPPPAKRSEPSPEEGTDSKEESPVGGCPMCGAGGGSRKRRRGNKSKKSRKQKRRASYRKKKVATKSRSPSEAIYASPPVPATITLPRMESSGPPVRS